MLVACGDDGSTNASGLPDDDQPKSSAKVKSSSSSKGKSSSSGKSSSNSGIKESSSSEELQEPQITVKEKCTQRGACEAMEKNDVSTWHFSRKDDLGGEAEYTYKVDGRDLIVTIKNADGTTDSKTYSMYNMESEAGVEMAFEAAKSTCKDGGGNDNVVKTCVNDTTWRLPKCTEEREGMEGKDSTGKDVICQNAGWHNKIVYGSLTDERDGQVYKTVKIGKQWWMAQNLNFKYKDPDSNFVLGNHCVSDSLCDKYGRLYSWSAAVDSAGFYSSDALGCGYYVMESNCGKKENNSRVRGVCPEGWHLPTYNEYETLFRYVGGMSVAGKMLKSTSGWEEGKTGIDEYGFSALPGGGATSSVGVGAQFWTSTEHYTTYNGSARYVYFDGLYDKADEYYIEKYKGNLVRCIKDDD